MFLFAKPHYSSAVPLLPKLSLCCILVALSLSQLSGCSTTSRVNHATVTPLKVTKPVDLNNTRLVKQKLLDQYRVWKGTPYLYGGDNQKGIDCSAFVQRTFAEKLGHRLPRTTLAQVKVGKTIAKKALKPGDIVFFRTGRNSRHNGIYLGNQQFIHASSSKGITISNLQNVYWQKTYWTAIRL